MQSGVKEKKIHPLLIHPVKEINDRRLYLIELLFFNFSISNSPIICLQYTFLLLCSSHPELPSLSVAAFQYSFSYGSFYFNIWGLIFGTILNGCRL